VNALAKIVPPMTLVYDWSRGPAETRRDHELADVLETYWRTRNAALTAYTEACDAIERRYQAGGFA
jgi:hypothetical protein